MIQDLSFAPLAELRRLLDGRQISARELATEAIASAETTGRSLNAVVSVLPERALVEAGRADRLLARGIRRPLLGIPYGAKDLLAARGAPTTWGSAAFAAQRFADDATAIARLARAGSVLVSKLAMLELAGMRSLELGSSLMGPCLNPWNTSYWAGGSSGGSAAAVAAGVVPFALGSDTGGSIACPAAYCGVTALRPTYGVVSRHGAMPVSWTVDKIGPLARSAADVALVFGAIAGRDRHDPATLGGRSARRRRDWFQQPLRAGFAGIDFEDRAPNAVRGPLRDGLGILQELGATLVETVIPELPYAAVHELITSAERASAFRPYLTDGSLTAVNDPEKIEGLRDALAISAADYLDAMRVRSRIRAGFDALFERVDVIVSPNFVVPWPPPRATGPAPIVPETGGNAAMVFAGNIAGLPAIYLPVGFSDEGLPVGIEVAGPALSDHALLGLGMRVQEGTSWHRGHPPFRSGTSRAGLSLEDPDPSLVPAAHQPPIASSPEA